MRIAFGKLGRSIPLTLDDASNVGGDVEVVRMLHKLLAAGHEVELIGRNRSNELYPFDGLTNHWGKGGIFDDPPEISRQRDDKFYAYDDFMREGAKLLPTYDRVFIWLGQHGSCLHPVPTVRENLIGVQDYTNPMGSDVSYGYSIVAILNYLGIKPTWLCPDPRNRIKFRDLWDPQQKVVMAQYNEDKNDTFFDERDGKLRKGRTRYQYSGIELLATQLDESWQLHDQPAMPFGLLVNEGYNNLKKKGRLHLIQYWCSTMISTEIVGVWSESSQETLGRAITPVPLAEVNATLQRWRSTITFPATGTGWATAKPWECFKAGCICFKHPDYDSQQHIYKQTWFQEVLGQQEGRELYDFLTPYSPNGLLSRIKQLDEERWRVAALQQYELFKAGHARLEGGMKMIMEAV